MKNETFELVSARLKGGRKSWREGLHEEHEKAARELLEYAESEGFSGPAVDVRVLDVLTAYENPERALANAKCALLDIRENQRRANNEECMRAHLRESNSRIAAALEKIAAALGSKS